MSKFITALDLGSSKIVLAVGEISDDGIKVVGYFDAPSSGVNGGEIVNDMKVESVVKELLNKAETSIPGLGTIEEAVVGISGRVLHSSSMDCNVTRSNPGSYIQSSEIDEMTRSRYKAVLENDEIVLEAVPQSYNTQEQVGMQRDDIIGVCSPTIESTFRIFSGKKPLLERRRIVMDHCGIKISKAILAPIASARAVLTSHEMENGAALVDIGKSVTEIAIIKDNIVRHIAVIPFGGESITKDIKHVANITAEWAEATKVSNGCCCEEYSPDNKKLVLHGTGGIIDGEIELTQLTRIIEARMSEIFDAVRYTIDQSGYAQKLNAGVVLTGGCIYLDSIMHLAKALLGQKVRLAAPMGSIDGASVDEAFDPYASTAVGLILEAADPMLSHTINRVSALVSTTMPKNPVKVDLFGDSVKQEPQSEDKKVDKSTRINIFDKKAKKKNTDGESRGIFDTLFGGLNDDNNNEA